jgi:hypothetical protein
MRLEVRHRSFELRREWRDKQGSTLHLVQDLCVLEPNTQLLISYVFLPSSNVIVSAIVARNIEYCE